MRELTAVRSSYSEGARLQLEQNCSRRTNDDAVVCVFVTAMNLNTPTIQF